MSEWEVSELSITPQTPNLNQVAQNSLGAWSLELGVGIYVKDAIYMTRMLPAGCSRAPVCS